MKKKLLVVGIFSFLSIFQSCNNNEELPAQDNGAKIVNVGKDNQANTSRVASDSQSLSGFVTNILATETQIKSLLDNETNVNYSTIQKGLQSVKTIEDLELLYKNANVSNVEELISLYKELDANAEIFINNNPDFYSKYNLEKRQDLLANEIDSQLGINDESESARSDCQAGFVKATRRCMRNYTLEVVGSVALGVFTGGVGGVISGAVATAQMALCNADAEDDYHTCVKGGGQP